MRNVYAMGLPALNLIYQTKHEAEKAKRNQGCAQIPGKAPRPGTWPDYIGFWSPAQDGYQPAAPQEGPEVQHPPGAFQIARIGRLDIADTNLSSTRSSVKSAGWNARGQVTCIKGKTVPVLSQRTVTTSAMFLTGEPVLGAHRTTNLTGG